MRRTQVSRSCLAPSLSPKCTSQDGVVCRPRKGGTSGGRLFAQRYGNGCCEKRRQSGQDEEKGGLLGGGITAFAPFKKKKKGGRTAAAVVYRQWGLQQRWGSILVMHTCAHFNNLYIRPP